MRHTYVKAGQLYDVVMPCSEVMMHMRLADTRMIVELIRNDYGHYRAEISDVLGFRTTVLPGEAGLYFDAAKKQYYFNEQE